MIECTQFLQPLETYRRSLRLQEKFFHFSPDSFGRQVREVDLSTQGHGFVIDHKVEPSGELGCTQYTKAVFWKCFSRYGAKDAVPQILLAMKRIDYLPRQGIVENGINRKIPSSPSLHKPHPWITIDDEGTMPSTTFAI